ncbi:NAD(+) diphosphatase [Butyrivibrio sp. CB08]|uniref:NAD(+) diphosphatase n=1 Tax=Butyrivibrio sp. CB08 TaxID=2364879 RepID=UPI000EA9A868|nr:NAD(+) diphosphatase [Butyrivibrio sp. CB08]RKM61906.1 NAD(+) diphosphatase [Butyrivibrio sp. CB08]
MIQDIAPYKLNNHYEPEATATSESLLFVFKGKELLINLDRDAKTLTLPKLSDFKGIAKTDLIYLFSIGDDKFFLLPAKADSEEPEPTAEQGLPENFTFHGIFEFRSDYYEPKRYAFAAYTAYQLSEWYAATYFCGKCGSKNEYHKTERARICPKCGNIIYPRINPAVIIGVTDKDTNRLILTKYRTGFGHNALVAGFTEIGETLEETVEREVMEEVGLKVKNVRYYKSQPWGIASDILAGFFCDVDGEKEIQMDESELKYAEWVAPEDIALQPINYSLTNEMMTLFKEKGYDGTL